RRRSCPCGSASGKPHNPRTSGQESGQCPHDRGANMDDARRIAIARAALAEITLAQDFARAQDIARRAYREIASDPPPAARGQAVPPPKDATPKEPKSAREEINRAGLRE